jgi:hypothetical protein
MSTHSQVSRGPLRAAVLPDLLISIVGPVLVYRLAVAFLPATDALLLAGVLPLFRISIGLIRRRRLNLIGIFSLLAVMLKIFFALVLKDNRWVLVSDSLITAIYGVILLASLFTSSPLLLRLIESVLSNTPSAQSQQFLQRWSQPGARSLLTIITVVWGIGLLLECALQVLLAFTLPVEQVLLISPLVRYGVWAILLLWAFFFTRGRRSRRSRTPEGVSSKPEDKPITAQPSSPEKRS